MNKVKPSRPQRRTTKPVVEKELTTAMVEPAKMKYAPRDKVGTPKIGSPVTVKTVGLGKLEVITQHGYTDV